MDRLSQKMGHQTPKLRNKKLPPILLWIYSLRGFLALLLSPKTSLRGKKCSIKGGWDQAAFSLWEDSACLHKVSCLGKAICLVKSPVGNPRTGSLLCLLEDLTWNFFLEIC